MEGWHQFHLLRPWWLLALLPAVLLTLGLWRRRSSGAGWRRTIPAELLEHLLDRDAGPGSRWPWLALLAGWVLATLAMAGPTWQKLPQPVLQQRDALVIVLDLSLSMLAEDVKPSRLLRARYKILDILQRRQEGLTALVAYAGDAHVVSPLTDDAATVANLVPALAPEMMPLYGSNPAAAVRLAVELLDNGGDGHGRILLISDGIEESDVEAISALLRRGDHQLSVLGVATPQGAPIPMDGGFLKGSDGSIVIPTLTRQAFEALAQRSSGRFSEVRLDDSDLDVLLPSGSGDPREARTVEREFDQWLERGPWLAMLLLPLAALAFRRGWLLGLVLLLPLSQDTMALEWRDLWQRRDQQAAEALAAGDAATAAERFRDPAWRASAQYRAGDYDAAARSFARLPGADAAYNRGNALAQAGRLQEAITAYEEALAQDPGLEDAAANKAVVEQLLRQQPPEAGEQGQQQNDQDQNQGGQSSLARSQGQGNEQQEQSPTAQDQSGDAESGQPQTGQPSQPGQRQDTDSRQPGEDDEAGEANRQASRQDRDGEPESGEQSGESEEVLSEEEQRRAQATEQWLRQIPDDPSGLLRRKFEYEHRQRARRGEIRPGGQPLW